MSVPRRLFAGFVAGCAAWYAFPGVVWAGFVAGVAVAAVIDAAEAVDRRWDLSGRVETALIRFRDR